MILQCLCSAAGGGEGIVLLCWKGCLDTSVQGTQWGQCDLPPRLGQGVL